VAARSPMSAWRTTWNDQTNHPIPFGMTIDDWGELPRGLQWQEARKPDTHVVVRTRIVRSDDGELLKFFILRERGSQDSLAFLRRAEAIRDEIAEERAAGIVATDRALLAAKNARNGVRAPRRKKSRGRR
jgi:hypothetical protein